MKLTFTNKYVAFLDVMGFKELVQGSSVDKLENYFNIVDTSFEFFSEHRKTLDKLAISDSIIIATGDSIENFTALLKSIRMLQARCATSDIWLRGGISFGEVHFDQNTNTIVGRGFVNAYLLESQAVFPRVIIDPAILKKLDLIRRNFYDKFNKFPHEREHNEKLIHDYGINNTTRFTQDDSLFICYASKIISDSIKEKNNEILTIHTTLDTVCNNIKENLYKNQTHYTKYLWLKKYFQEALLEHYFLTSDNDFEKQFLDVHCNNFANL